MLDADLRRFEHGLNQTRSGMHLRLAIHEGNIAVAQIKRLQDLNSPQSARALATWRKAYISSCDRAAKAIDALWDQHQWPEHGARARDYEWKPSKRFSRPR
jgi:hypothetical protein